MMFKVTIDIKLIVDLNQNDSEDEEITYLTSLKNCESKYKRI